jgi:hypothetical protein
MIHLNFKKKISLICGMVLISALFADAAELPPDPNNAALLYYQAFMLHPEPDAAESYLVYGTRQEQIFETLRGGELGITLISKKISVCLKKGLLILE